MFRGGEMRSKESLVAVCSNCKSDDASSHDESSYEEGEISVIFNR